MRRTGGVTLALVVCAAGLAGCIGVADVVEMGEIGPPGSTPGQYWRYSFVGDFRLFGAEPGIPQDAAGAFTVVAGQTGGGQPMALTDSCEAEFRRGAISPINAWPSGTDNLGRVLLDWPLHEGKEWSFEWLASALHARVTHVTATGIAEILIVDDQGHEHFLLRYDENAGWFSFFADLVLGITYRLEATGTEYQETVCSLVTTTLYDEPLQDGVVEFKLDVPWPHGLLVRQSVGASAQFPGGLGVYQLEYKDPGEGEYVTLMEETFICLAASCGMARSQADHLRATPGEWEWRITTMGFEGDLRIDHLEFMLRSFDG